MSLKALRSLFQDELADRASDFVVNTPQHFTSTSPIFDTLQNTNLINFRTETNDFPAFPQTYSQLNDLVGGEFKSLGDGLKNHGWSDLYNKDHTSKNISNPSPRSNNPFQPFQYGNPNVNQNLNIRSDSSSLRTSVISGVGKLISNLGLDGSFSQFLQDAGREPYIVSNLPTGKFDLSNGRLVNAGSRLIPLARPIADTLRVGKYLTSPAGVLNLAAKNAQLIVPTAVVINKGRTGLVRVPQRFNAGFNPLSTLISTGARALGSGVPNFLTKSGFTGEYGSSSALMRGYTPKSEDRLSNSFTGATTDVDFQKIPSAEDGGGFFSKIGVDGGVVKPTSTGDRMTLAPMIKGDNLKLGGNETKALKDGKVNEVDGIKQTFSTDIDSSKEGMPLYFKDLRDDTYLFFRAFLEGITEDIAPTWAETNYIGRSEPVYVYERATRSITFTLKMYAQTKLELNAIWKKINRLTSLCYPEYAKDELLEEYLTQAADTGIVGSAPKTRMKLPLMKMRLGDMFGSTNKELLGFLESVSYSIPESSTWETSIDQKVPKHITATITYKVIHDEVPGLKNEYGREYSFYGVTRYKPPAGGAPGVGGNPTDATNEFL